MKSDISKLKNKIFLHILFVTIVFSLIGLFIILSMTNGVFSNFVRSILENVFLMDSNGSYYFYNDIIRGNKSILLVITFIIILLIGFYFALSKLTTYFNQTIEGVDKLLDENHETIKLSPELEFMENKLNTVKKTLRDRKEQAQESEQRKNDLVVYLAHDIKTPLTSVIGYLTLLNEAYDMPVEQRKKYTDIALDKSLKLEDLINEFFEITRFNLQNIELKKEEVNLSLMLKQLSDEFYPSFSAKSITCNVFSDEDIYITCDANKLARVFNNILKNALTYSYDNSEIKIIEKNFGNYVEITFQNKGKKIPDHQLNTIFEKFYRLDSARSTNTGGSGLGLAIAKEIVELHGGKILANSNNDFTNFIIKLPKSKLN
ncbi:HAMP domain-containing histidine kinase [Clostridioides mangenotii]|nr:HAMP domain-containing sensor histidine kinase [Clostridioides mangenotii]MBU5307405.1 HAMP domain-containing histidine kinase [Clostridioides mangenotii]